MMRTLCSTAHTGTKQQSLAQLWKRSATPWYVEELSCQVEVQVQVKEAIVAWCKLSSELG
jgi:hypothetical protein